MGRLVLMILILSIAIGPGVSAEVFVVEKAKKNVFMTGFTRSIKTVTVSSEMGGKVIKADCEVGKEIKDDPLYMIDTTFIDLQIQRLTQSLDKLNIALAQSQSRVEFLQKEFNRIDKLHQGDRATGVRRDAAFEEWKQSQFRNTSLEKDHAILETQLQELVEQKKRYTIYGQPGWIVVDKRIERGEVVGPGTPVVRIADYRSLVVPLFVSTSEYKALQNLPKTFNAQIEEKNVTAKIHWVNPEFNEQTRKLSIEILIVNYNGQKRGGLQFKLPLTLETEGLLIPKKAVTNRYDNPRVTLAESGKFVNVMVLEESDDYLIVAESEQVHVGSKLSPAP